MVETVWKEGPKGILGHVHRIRVQVGRTPGYSNSRLESSTDNIPHSAVVLLSRTSSMIDSW